MTAATDLVHDLLAALAGVPGLRPATPVATGRAPWGWNRDAMAIDLNPAVSRGADAGHTVVVRVVATQLPLPPLVRRAEQALSAVLATSELPVTRLRLEVTDLDGAAFA
ncbi:hypothetical protein [Actinophytocola xanthii]|uniref:Asp23/Gls24 family protein n=1 Tax=Actinophytocola xanthii TaxID=1912961 RepID=A0A1Q8BSB1_9PSEU|nr:hypothetical protein [Actinophytocola xanthii]OLF04997.1 hypothetical protein BU204_37500 [Actinophytocola xanthii]